MRWTVAFTGPSVRGRTLFVRGCRGETGAVDRGVHRAERSRSDFVCPGMSGRDWCGGPWRSQGRAFEVGLCLSGDVGERLVRWTVAFTGPSVRGRTLFVRGCRGETGAVDRGVHRAERSRSDFVCPGMSGRNWCGGPWRAGPSVRGRTLFVRGCRGETGAEDRGAQGRAFEIGICLSGRCL